MPPTLDAIQQFQQNALLAAVNLGRNQYPEILAQDSTQTFAAPVSPVIPDYINLNRPLGDFLVNWKGRIAVTGANYTAVSPDAPQNILQNFKVYGNHAIYNQQTPWNVSGATAFLMGRITQAIGGSQSIVNNVRVADPGQPQTAGVALTTAGSPYDCDLWWWFPMYPLIGQGRDAKIQQVPYFLNGDDWGNSLKVQWSWGDKTALGDPTGATVAITAYGSGAGNPTIALYGNYCINGDLQGKIGNPGLVVRNEVYLNQFTNATAQPVQILALQQAPTTSILVRSGILQASAVTSSGVQTYASLSDRQIDQTSIYVDRRPQRQNFSNMSYKAFTQGKQNTIIPQGTFTIPFDESQSILNANRLDTLSPSTQIQLMSQILSTNALNQLSVVQEMVYGGPFGR